MEPVADPEAFEISPGREGSDTTADVETPIDGSEAVGTRERDRRQPKPIAVPHPAPAERGARGKAARAVAPRSGQEVQLRGDAHLSNFGAFAGPDRRLVSRINDFDETLPGPFEWDVKRLVASVAVAGRDRGSAHRDR